MGCQHVRGVGVTHYYYAEQGGSQWWKKSESPSWAPASALPHFPGSASLAPSLTLHPLSLLPPVLCPPTLTPWLCPLPPKA